MTFLRTTTSLLPALSFSLYWSTAYVVPMLGEVLAVITALAWAASTVLSAEALRKMAPIRFNAVRAFFSTLVMLPIAFVAGEMNNLFEVSLFGLFLVTLSAIVGIGVGDSLFYKSITLVGVSSAYTIAYIYPLFTMVMAVLFLGESFQLKYLIGAILITLSIIIISTENYQKNHADFHLKGFLMAGATALIWSAGLNLMALGLREISVLLANALRFPFLSLFLFSFSQPRKELNLNRKDWTIIFASGILGMVLGNITFLFGIQLIGASRTASLSASSPLWASIMSSLILKEKVTPRLLLSSAIVVIGIYFLH